MPRSNCPLMGPRKRVVFLVLIYEDAQQISPVGAEDRPLPPSIQVDLSAWPLLCLFLWASLKPIVVE